MKAKEIQQNEQDLETYERYLQLLEMLDQISKVKQFDAHIKKSTVFILTTKPALRATCPKPKQSVTILLKEKRRSLMSEGRQSRQGRERIKK